MQRKTLGVNKRFFCIPGRDKYSFFLKKKKEYWNFHLQCNWCSLKQLITFTPEEPLYSWEGKCNWKLKAIHCYDSQLRMGIIIDGIFWMCACVSLWWFLNECCQPVFFNWKSTCRTMAIGNGYQLETVYSPRAEKHKGFEEGLFLPFWGKSQLFLHFLSKQCNRVTVTSSGWLFRSDI